MQTPYETGFYKCVELGLDNRLDRAIQCNPYPRNSQDSGEFYKGWREAQGKDFMTFKGKKNAHQD